MLDLAKCCALRDPCAKYANNAEYPPYTNYAKYDTFTKTVDMMELKYIIRLVIVDRPL